MKDMKKKLQNPKRGKQTCRVGEFKTVLFLQHVKADQNVMCIRILSNIIVIVVTYMCVSMQTHTFQFNIAGRQYEKLALQI